MLIKLFVIDYYFVSKKVEQKTYYTTAFSRKKAEAATRHLEDNEVNILSVKCLGEVNPET